MNALASTCSDTTPLLGRAASSEEMPGPAEYYRDCSIPEGHIASILRAFGTVDLDLANDVLQVRNKTDSLRAAYFRQGRLLLSDGQSSSAHFQALTAAFEIVSNPTWLQQFQEYRLVERSQERPYGMRRTKSWNGSPTSVADATERAFSDAIISSAFGRASREQQSKAKCAVPGTPEYILHDLQKPRATPSKKKKAVHFNLEAVEMFDDTKENNKVRCNVTSPDTIDDAKSTISSKESLLERASLFDVSMTASEASAKEDKSARTSSDPDSFLAFVRKVLGDAFESVKNGVPPDAATAKQVVDEYMQKFAKELSSAGDKLSVDLAAVHKTVMESMRLPDDENISQVLGVLSMESCQLEEALKSVEREIKQAASHVPRSYTM